MEILIWWALFTYISWWIEIFPHFPTFLVRLKEHSSNGKCGGGGFYLIAHIPQSIHPRKLNLDLNDRRQKSYLESTLILAILSKFFS